MRIAGINNTTAKGFILTPVGFQIRKTVGYTVGSP